MTIQMPGPLEVPEVSTGQEQSINKSSIVLVLIPVMLGRPLSGAHSLDPILWSPLSTSLDLLALGEGNAWRSLKKENDGGGI